jgi:3-oxoacyl-[acyl-carrier protein] reductase
MASRRKLAIVTGAGRGLGRLITLELAAAGVDVLMIGRGGEALRRTADETARAGAAHAFPMPCDIGAPGAVAAILAAAADAGGADILVNNAAIQGPIGPAWEIDDDAFARTMRLNFLMPVALTRAVLPAMLTRGAGWIVNISGGGATSPRPMLSAYSAAKVALVRFGETLAAELAGRGVRVNSVAPGAFASGMTHAILAAGAHAGQQEADAAERLATSGDEGNAVQAAKLVAYLVAGAGSEVTGKLLSAVWDPWRELHCHWDAIRDSDVYTLRRILPGDRRLEWG